MARITGEVLIDAAITEVFDTVADERNEPRYNPRIVRAEMLTHEPVGAGSRFVAEPKRMGARGRMALEIVEYQRPHRLHNVICSSYAYAHGTLTFAETDGAAHGCGVGLGHAAGRPHAGAHARVGVRWPPVGTAQLGRPQELPRRSEPLNTGPPLPDLDQINVMRFLLPGGPAPPVRRSGVDQGCVGSFRMCSSKKASSRLPGIRGCRRPSWMTTTSGDGPGHSGKARNEPSTSSVFIGPVCACRTRATSTHDHPPRSARHELGPVWQTPLPNTTEPPRPSDLRHADEHAARSCAGFCPAPAATTGDPALVTLRVTIIAGVSGEGSAT